MARHVEPREDLLIEATALVERIELAAGGSEQPIVAGFRRDGSASVFFGSDPVYQFNSAGQLRRAFVGDLLYRADRGQLAALRRERSDSGVALVRHNLTAAETQEFLRVMQSRLIDMREAIAQRAVRVLRQVPAEADVLPRVQSWLERFGDHPVIARSPRVG